MYGRVGVELCYQREEFSLGAIRTVAMLERSPPDLAALLDLPAHIDVACRIVADQPRRKCRRGPVGLREIRYVMGEIGHQLLDRRRAFDHAGHLSITDTEDLAGTAKHTLQQLNKTRTGG